MKNMRAEEKKWKKYKKKMRKSRVGLKMQRDEKV